MKTNLRSLFHKALFHIVAALHWLGSLFSASARRRYIFRASLSRGPARFYDPNNGKPVYQWYDKNGFVYLGQDRWGKMVFFSHEDIEALPRQQRRKALREIDKRLQKAVK